MKWEPFFLHCGKMLTRFMKILDGKSISQQGKDRLVREIKELGFSPTLAILQVGADERSDSYISQKKKFAEGVGARVMHRRFDGGTEEAKLFFEIERLNQDSTVNGIIIQLPIPDIYKKFELIEAISPLKDVDGLTAYNLKKLLEGGEGVLPATAKGIVSLLESSGVVIEGKTVVVIGRSVLAGKSIALALLNRNATIVIAHSKTKNLEEVAKQGDILVTAAGQPGLITKGHVRPGQVVVDVGISLVGAGKVEEEIIGKKLVGDVDFDTVAPIVEAISPVPGGVGPMTVLSLFENLLAVAKSQKLSNNQK